MGLQDVFFKLRLPFDSAEAKALSRTISEDIYFHALWASTELAEHNGPHEAYEETRAAKGELQFDLWDRQTAASRRRPNSTGTRCVRRIAEHGLRNSLLIAIAPTATIASIAGCYECIEPQVSNLFKRETLSGEFLQINRYLVRELQALGLWDEQMIADIKRAEGSVQDVDAHPRRAPGDLPHRVGAPAAGADRHGRRARRLHRPEPVAQPVHGDADHRQALLDVPARLEGRAEDHLLPAPRPATRINQTTSGAATKATATPAAPTPSGSVGRWRSDARTGEEDLHRRRGHRVLPREPRVLRGMPVMALIDPITDYAPAAPGETLADEFESASPVGAKRPTNMLDPGFDLTLRPMRYPQFYEMYRDAIKNTWTVEEVDFSDDLVDLDRKLMPAERHLVERLVAFFATGDSIVSNNLVLNLYQHINAPEARMYLSRQLYEEALHVQFYLTLLDTYIPDLTERDAAFAAVENIPSIRAQGRVLLQVDRLDPGSASASRRPRSASSSCST